MLRSVSFVGAVLAVAFLLLSQQALAVIVATTADDVCSASADPCEITDEVLIQPGAVLDFGVRTVRLSGSGKLNFGSSSATVRCGDLDAKVATTAIKIKESVAGEVIGGNAFIMARRACSRDLSLPCLNDNACALVSAGTCTAGPLGQVTLAGKILGDGVLPGNLDIIAMGDITFTRAINLSGTTVDSDGGLIDLLSVNGSVVVAGGIDGSAGIFGVGGDVVIVAGSDITVSSTIDLSGSGEADGGSVDLQADRDINISGDILCKAGASLGGDIFADAGRDLVISGGTSGNPVLISTSASMSSLGDSGDAGDVGFTAGRDIDVGEFVKIQGNGSPPDGSGSFALELLADRDLNHRGQIEARARGNDGDGGDVVLSAAGTLNVLPTGQIDVRGGSIGAGLVEMFAGTGLSFSGSLDATANNGGNGGAVFIDSDAQVHIDGSLVTSSGGGSMNIMGCEIFVDPGGTIANDGGLGITTVTGRGVIEPQSITVAAGASLSALGISGENRLVYLDALKPPVINGTVTPAALLQISAVVPACSGCGDGVVDPGETCDDGNKIGGDGCSSGCQLESCIGQSLDYPNQPLCNDGVGCTVDTCNIATGNCDHVVNCDDAVACTVDQCVADQCVHTPDHVLCDDADVCTDDVCSQSLGCLHDNNLAACDDGVFCNGADSCIGGSCVTHAGTPCGAECLAGCDEATTSCLPAAQGQVCSDEGNLCTDDVCDGLGFCGHVPNTLPCDDGIGCTLADQCAGGTCTGSPDDLLCDDADVCTDDLCSVVSGCSFVNNSAACDDGDVCTINDVCNGGICAGGSPCGDGVLQSGCGEECDPPDGVSCDSACLLIVCGNGIVQPGETCDDGNTSGGDCCDASCQVDGLGTSCGDGDVCNGDEICDGGGVCLPGTPLDCSDGDACSQDSCDPVAGCSSVPEPATTCFAAGKSAFQLTKKSNSAKSSLKWKWSKGDRVFLSDLGQPRSSTEYVLCIYDGSGAVAVPVGSVVVPPSSGNWARKGSKGYKYKDKAGTAAGVRAVALVSGRSGKSKAQLKAKGANVPLPIPVSTTSFFAQDPNVTVQLFNDNDVCWTSEFAPSGTKKNTGGKFSAKSP